MLRVGIGIADFALFCLFPPVFTGFYACAFFRVQFGIFDSVFFEFFLAFIRVAIIVHSAASAGFCCAFFTVDFDSVTRFFVTRATTRGVPSTRVFISWEKFPSKICFALCADASVSVYRGFWNSFSHSF